MLHPLHQLPPKLRTLILKPYIEVGTELSLPDVWSTFKCLRALRVHELGTDLPEYIGNLKHLRSLDLSSSYGCKNLPESICGLRNLQTLKLNDCSNLETLPKSLSNLRSLRHLEISGCWKLREMPMDMGKMTCLQALSLFIVGSNKGQYITELEKMDSLSGELKITCIEKVRSRRDAEYTNLMRKKRLGTLSIDWSDQHTDEENDKEVIEGLRPNSNLRKLYIRNYQGISFPNWLEYSILPNLVVIYLAGCKRCQVLPPSLGRLPLLKVLWVRGMPLVKTLFSDSDIDSDDVVNRFPSLELLSLQDLPELEEWCSFTRKDGVEEQMFLLQNLKELNIESSPKLKRLPMSPSLKILYMEKCNEMVLGSVKNMHCLSRLQIGKFDEVICFPEGSLQNLTALEHLCIQGLNKLQNLPRQAGDLSKLISLPQVGRSCLSGLRIGNCQSLTNLTGVVSECQTTLRSLTIDGCPKLEWSSLEFEQLTALQELNILRFPEMTLLPDGIQHLSSTLKVLRLEALALSSLPQWIEGLTQLQDLQISHCKKLTILPDGLRHLTKLHTLYTTECHPDMYRQCENGQGKDWHNFSHIPNLDIRQD